ncbi:MAG TPA: aminotransferase class I/II-fold pyridoxal phosphate-dependent enzyme [Methylomusa anaerophila]|uniref:Aromatic-amino-acid aminotransferase n=1 Tax=Methylomusa anaerophila TaxID=1930071 RepID=A0A348ANJ3_9FIRM|nr:aminotransferase class I/II-fold pyridoxal phosphate-dependent enzyme [Methylomusa anaerophila]BBB92641.1 aromatic-amino-acid aminotransferase [Methylomusa anaerophila]HML87506.1 aminotransferase class I/II-fold pyridoxal phosphate-dependent enzyme [Methylomusa anaerophila]
MTNSFAATHAKGKLATDTIFGAGSAANQAVTRFGKDKVVNATIGVILDDNEMLVCLPTVEKVFRNLPITEVTNYAPIAGLPDFLEAAAALTFAENRPDAYINAVATAGGSGVIHHTIWNYSEIGDTLLTSDWYWDPYKVLCEDALRKIDTYSLFDENGKFNIKSFESKVNELLAKQNNLVIIINTPAHNPTGYNLTDSEWDQILDVVSAATRSKEKRIVLLVDIAYIDYAGDKNESRGFMKKFGNMPDDILVVLAFSMSKGYTMYGQRTGAMIGISKNKDVVKEFEDINQFTSRATWSNINRGCMKLLSTIYNDKAVLAQVEAERGTCYRMIQERAAVFMREAKAVNLFMLPYVAGFFLTIPAQKPNAVCDKLHEDNVYAVPLDKGVRIAVCAVPATKISGMAGKVVKALAAVEG